jgi:hypothetical protein
MKIGQTFPLPSNAYKPGKCGNIIEDNLIVGRYEVVQEGDILLGKVIVTYGHQGRKRNAKRSAKHRQERRMADAKAHKVSND